MIKKTVITVMLLLTVIFTLGATSSYADNTGKVTISSLNIRKGPSTKYNVIGSLQKNQTVTILDSNNGWYKIQGPDNKKGWSNGKYISLDKELVKPEGDNNNSKTSVQVVATAYTGYGITSTGQKPIWGTIAVDPRVIPYGTKVYIPCFNKVFIANNTGGAIKGNKIDIYMNSNKECYNWGRKTIEIQILK
ncbi:3D domain-containing protein [Romboutsia sp.]|uniref:3D domain-containing protein n=1 Tax=Romboutsia sp. TaxID=1965302 RepID=UPI003F3E685F